MNEAMTAEVLFTFRAIGIALACAWGIRGVRGRVQIRRVSWHLWATVLATGAVAIGGYAAWRYMP